MDALHAAVRSFCAAREWDRYHTPQALAIGITTEAAELLQEFRFLGARRAGGAVRRPRRSGSGRGRVCGRAVLPIAAGRPTRHRPRGRPTSQAREERRAVPPDGGLKMPLWEF